MTNPIRITRSARRQVKELALPLTFAAAEKIAEASNKQSSWGGYKAYKGRGGRSAGRSAVVGFTHSASVDNARSQRILRNVNAGKEALQ